MQGSWAESSGIKFAGECSPVNWRSRRNQNKTSEEGGKIVLKFGDNGRGFSQDYLKRIFDPSFSTKGARVEMGLGLPIAYNIVKEHGGEITVESELGIGTEFTIILNKTLNRAISNETTAKESSANA